MSEATMAETRAGRGRAGRPEAAAGDQEFIQSLAKGLAVIEAFSEASPQMTLSEVSRQVGLSPGSARRVLRTLQILGYASMQGTRFELTPRVLKLGYSYLNSLPVANLVRPRLTQLTEEIGANTAISVLDGPDMVFVARSTAKSTERERISVGSRFPAHATSAGKILMSDMNLPELEALFGGGSLEPLTANTIVDIVDLHDSLRQVRADGWAFSDQEAMTGHRSITVPVRINGQIVAAVGAGAVASSATVARMMSFLPALQTAAEGIAELVGNHAADSPLGGRAAARRRQGRSL